MEITELLEKTLGLGEDWTIKDVKVNQIYKELDIYLEYTRDTCFYSDEEPECTVYDYSKKKRRIQHTDFLDFKTYLNFKTPRAKLSNGKIKVIPLKFADERSDCTYDFEERRNFFCQ